MHAGVGVVVAPGVDVFAIKVAVGVDHRHQIVGQLEGFVFGAGAAGRAHFHLMDAQPAIDPVGLGVGALAAAVADRVAVGGGGQVLELHQATVIGVGHIEIAVQIGAHAARAFEMIHIAAAIAEAAEHVVQGQLAGAGVDAENFDAVIAVVGHVEIGRAVVRGLIIGHALRDAVAVTLGRFTGVVVVVGRIGAVVFVDAANDRSGPDIVATAVLMPQGLDQADLVTVIRINAERFDTVVELIGHIDKALRRDGHIARQVDVLAATVTGLAEGGDVFEVASGGTDGAKEMNLVEAHVVDVEAGKTVVVRLAGGQESDPQWRANLGYGASRAVRRQGLVGVVEPAGERAVEVQHLDLMVAHVGHVDACVGCSLG